MSATLGRAYALARSAHYGQVDKAGRPYFDTHVAPLVRRVVGYGGDETLQVIALLHRIVARTPVTLIGLRIAGYPPLAVDAVDALTRRQGEPGEAYRGRVMANPAAVAVAIAHERSPIGVGLCAYPRDIDGEHDHADCADTVFTLAEEHLGALHP